MFKKYQLKTQISCVNSILLKTGNGKILLLTRNFFVGITSDQTLIIVDHLFACSMTYFWC